jgi:hypothetical protein
MPIEHPKRGKPAADIRFAQAQVRNFAQAERSYIRDIEAETLAA